MALNKSVVFVTHTTAVTFFYTVLLGIMTPDLYGLAWGSSIRHIVKNPMKYYCREYVRQDKKKITLAYKARLRWLRFEMNARLIFAGRRSNMQQAEAKDSFDGYLMLDKSCGYRQ